MKKTIATAVLGISALGLVGSANALSFNEAQGSSFEQYLTVTPTLNDHLLFAVSALNSQFESLSFQFLAFAGLHEQATNAMIPTVKIAIFDDNANGSFNLVTGTPYTVKIWGQTSASILGGHGTFSITALNATVASAAVAAVPEPETYAMFLAGLGVVGAIARRRKLRG